MVLGAKADVGDGKECGCDDLTCCCDVTGICLSKTDSSDCECVKEYRDAREGLEFFGHDQHWQDWTDSISEESKNGSLYLFLDDLPRKTDLNHLGVFIGELKKRIDRLESEVDELRNQT